MIEKPKENHKEYFRLASLITTNNDRIKTKINKNFTQMLKKIFSNKKERKKEQRKRINEIANIKENTSDFFKLKRSCKSKKNILDIMKIIMQKTVIFMKFLDNKY